MSEKNYNVRGRIGSQSINTNVNAYSKKQAKYKVAFEISKGSDMSSFQVFKKMRVKVVER